MELTFGSRLKHAWSAFLNRDPTGNTIHVDVGPEYSYRPDRTRLTKGNERTIVTSIFNRIAMDVANTKIVHCRVDDNDRFVEKIKSSLNDCLSLEANIDQTARAFIQDVVMSMLDEGCVAIVPVDTDLNPIKTGSYDILSMRTGKIIGWYPKHVKVRVYNDNTGIQEDIVLPKNMVGIVENPLYSIINEPNSTMQRLTRKLSLLDAVDERNNSGKLDMIIQLPYTVKTETRRQHAEKRREDIMEQIKGPLGIAYVDGTENIIQLNRPLENNLMKQIEYLTSMLWSQLGMTQAILDGTADEQQMTNYNSRIIEPIVSAIVDEMKRKFLTKTARTKKQSIKFFIDPFKLVTVSNVANFADAFTRNEILSSNEIRQIIGFVPSQDPKADQLLNSNLNHPEEGMMPPEGEMMPEEEMMEEQYPEEMYEEAPEEGSIKDAPISQFMELRKKIESKGGNSQNG